MSKYSDKRSDFFKNYFDKALDYENYINTGTDLEKEKWRSYEQEVKLAPELIDRISSFKRKLNILVMSGIWCGDCIRQGPIFNAIQKQSKLFNFKFIDNRENPELLEELKINGAQKVPVIVCLTEDFYEVSRFGDKHLSVYRAKVDKELGAACDPGILPPEQSALELEINEWIDYFERLQHMLRLAPALRKRYND